MIGLVYLLWAPLGLEPVRRFLASYDAHPAGAQHELLIVLNGAGDTAGADAPARTEFSDRAGRVYGDGDVGAVGFRAQLTELLRAVPHRLLSTEQPVLDLAAYGAAAQHWRHERLCFCNSYSVVLADGWLGRIAAALDDPGVGVAGASGSWESQSECRRGKMRYWPYQLARLPAARRDYPRFPNPHIRTTGFALRRETLLGLGLEHALDKRDTYLLESGHHSITRQLLDRGQRAVVVDRDGRLYEPDDWPHSHTYRSGDQRGLLIADRRSEDWRRASPRLRRRLSRDAWGEPL